MVFDDVTFHISKNYLAADSQLYEHRKIQPKESKKISFSMIFEGLVITHPTFYALA